MSVPLKLTLFGANGRMGKELRALIKERPGACVRMRDRPTTDDRTRHASSRRKDPSPV